MSSAAAIGYCLFPTAVGACGIAWGSRGVVAAALPAPRDQTTAERLARRTGARRTDPPPEIASVVSRITRLLAGEVADFADVAVDLTDLTPFHRSVLELTRAIPRGTTRTYGALAADLGDPLFARDVGQALGSNPVPIIIPCHRVVGAGEKLVGFSAPGGLATKRRLLAIEGVWLDGGPTLFEHAGLTV